MIRLSTCSCRVQAVCFVTIIYRMLVTYAFKSLLNIVLRSGCFFWPWTISCSSTFAASAFRSLFCANSLTFLFLPRIKPLPENKKINEYNCNSSRAYCNQTTVLAFNVIRPSCSCHMMKIYKYNHIHSANTRLNNMSLTRVITFKKNNISQIKGDTYSCV